MAWKNLEEKVRNIAIARWNCNAVAEEIAGIKYCVWNSIKSKCSTSNRKLQHRTF